MKYRNGRDVLPERLIREIQKYVDGTYLYIPRKNNFRRSWGQNSGYRDSIRQRNAEIRSAFRSGKSLVQLAQEHSLSVKTIESIVYAKEGRFETVHIETERLIITEFTEDMAQVVHENSMDDDVRRFVPDEVFETPEIAAETIAFLMTRYTEGDGPLVYPVLTKAGDNIGYVQAVSLDDGSWEIGYHIAKRCTGNGYASEAVRGFLPVIMDQLKISEILGVCLSENSASIRVLAASGFEKIFEGESLYQGETRNVTKYIYRRHG